MLQLSLRLLDDDQIHVKHCITNSLLCQPGPMGSSIARIPHLFLGKRRVMAIAMAISTQETAMKKPKAKKSTPRKSKPLTEAKDEQALLLPLSLIKPIKNIRDKLDDIESLAESIRVNGRNCAGRSEIYFYFSALFRRRG